MKPLRVGVYQNKDGCTFWLLDGTQGPPRVFVAAGPDDQRGGEDRLLRDMPRLKAVAEVLTKRDWAILVAQGGAVLYRMDVHGNYVGTRRIT